MASTSLIFDPPEFPQNFPYKAQSYVVAGTAKEGQTPHLRNPVWSELPAPGRTDFKPTTTHEIFEAGLQRSATRMCLGIRPRLAPDAKANTPASNEVKYADHYVWETYEQVNKRKLDLGSAIEGLFRSGKAGGGELPTVGIWSINRPEWQIIDQALAVYSRVTVSLYDTLGPTVVEYVLNHSEASMAFVTQENLPRLIALGPRCPKLRVIVSIDDLSEGATRVAQAWAKEYRLELYTMKQLEVMGAQTRYPVNPPKPHDLATICYTSGTTSVPKGVLLTHYNLTSGVYAFSLGLPWHEGAMLSYLPLSHIYERINELSTFLLGAGIGFFTGDPLRLIEDAQVLKPRFFPCVPRVVNRLALGIQQAAAAPGIRGALVRKALEVKKRNYETTSATTHKFWDALVFRKVQAILGGQVLIMTCGSAPVDPETLTLLRISMGCDVIEGWGMTENCAAGTRIHPKDTTAGGTVGFPHPCNEVKLVDVPSMNYTSKDVPNPRGELCARGPCVFKGYYKDPKNTAEALDSEGWLHSGDIAELDSQGRLKIIDRIKNIMKLSQGEYVALEKIEQTYSSHPLIAQLYVHGDSLQSYLLGVLVPELPTLADLISKTLRVHVAADDVQKLQEYLANPKVQSTIQNALNAQAKHHKLKGFECVKKVHVTLEPFTVENDMLTPTFKLRRRDVYARYKKILDDMYKEGAGETTKL